MWVAKAEVAPVKFTNSSDSRFTQNKGASSRSATGCYKKINSM